MVSMYSFLKQGLSILFVPSKPMCVSERSERLYNCHYNTRYCNIVRENEDKGMTKKETTLVFVDKIDKNVLF